MYIEVITRSSYFVLASVKIIEDRHRNHGRYYHRPCYPRHDMGGRVLIFSNSTLIPDTVLSLSSGKLSHVPPVILPKASAVIYLLGI